MENIYVVMNGDNPIAGFRSFADAEELCADLTFDACYEQFYYALQTGIYRWRHNPNDDRLKLALDDARSSGYSYWIMGVPVN